MSVALVSHSDSQFYVGLCLELISDSFLYCWFQKLARSVSSAAREHVFRRIAAARNVLVQTRVVREFVSIRTSAARSVRAQRSVAKVPAFLKMCVALPALEVKLVANLVGFVLG